MTKRTGGDGGLVNVATVDELEREGRIVTNAGGNSIVVFRHEGDVHAVDLRCPHMGFPLSKGTVEDGVLTCHWHHARFELSCGDTFDPWADDVPAYPTEIRDGQVYVRPEPERDRSPAERWADRLETGMEENLRLVIAKSVIGLDDAGVPQAEPLAQGVEFGTRYRADGWSSGLTILAAMANVFDDLRPEDRRRAMYTGLRHVASDCAGEPPAFDQPAFDADEVPFERLKGWFRENVEVRDADGAERVLRTAVETCSREEVEEMLFAAATDHVYLDTGHTLDFCNKAVETLDRVGWERADDVLASLIPSLTDATRSEEQSEWRQPVDVAGLLFDVYGGGPNETEGLEALVEEGGGLTGSGDWERPDGFRDTLLDDDPHAIVDALTDAVAAGASPADLADAVCDAAATRVAQFSPSNEFSDWNTVHHTFTYANAVREATHRVETVELYRGVFDAAMNVYLDRFLNQPAIPIPDPDAVAADRDPETVLDDLLAVFDREGEVNRAGELVGEFLAADGDVADLAETLGEGLLREDAGFHTLQAYEAGLREYERARSERERRTALVAVARYQAAHFPTRREAEQTYTIADRLHRGEKIHEA
ncbi:MAG: nitrite reductase/ring-hydroxylating ferredoxin subunit [Halobacteriales archaeon]|jgi:nitrite reductase/ring-hydroxylating ferredoxin subunit